jgi:hypothetical protein
MPLSSYLDNPEVAETIGIAWQYTPDHISKYFSIDDQESQHTLTNRFPAPKHVPHQNTLYQYFKILIIK